MEAVHGVEELTLAVKYGVNCVLQRSLVTCILVRDICRRHFEQICGNKGTNLLEDDREVLITGTDRSMLGNATFLKKLVQLDSFVSWDEMINAVEHGENKKGFRVDLLGSLALLGVLEGI